MSSFVLGSIEQARIDDDWERFQKACDYQEAFYDIVCKECFEIVYYGGYDANYVDSLSPVERKQVIQMINEHRQKDDENQAKLLATILKGGPK